MNNTPQDKIDLLIEEEGLGSIDEVLTNTSLMFDSVTPGICMNPDCDYTTEVEPDCATGYCEICETQSVKSLFILLDVI